MKSKILLMFFIIIISSFIVYSDPFLTQVIQAQGLKNTTSGLALNTTYTFNYSVYNEPSGGTPITSTGSRNIQIRDGILSDNTPEFNFVTNHSKQYYREVMINGAIFSTRINLTNAVLFSTFANNSLYLNYLPASYYLDYNNLINTPAIITDTNDTGLYYPNSTVDSLILGNISEVTGNASWNETYADTLYADITFANNIKGYSCIGPSYVDGFDSSGSPSCSIPSGSTGDNTSWNESYADTLYADISVVDTNCSVDSSCDAVTYDSELSYSTRASLGLDTTDSPTFANVDVSTSLRHAGDTDTGITFGTDAFQINIGSLNTFYIDSNGVGRWNFANRATGDLIIEGDINDYATFDAGGEFLDVAAYKVNGGVTINEISTDDAFSGNSDSALVTEQSIKAYVDANAGGNSSWNESYADTIYYTKTILDLIIPGNDTNDTGLYYPNATVDALILGNSSGAYQDAWINTTINSVVSGNASLFYPNATVDSLIDGNISGLSATYVARNDWTTIDNYPSACTGNEFVQGLGDTLSCAIPTDTNLSGESAGGDLSGTYPNPAVQDDSHAHTGTTISSLDTGDITTGTFADARISESSVTQHESAFIVNANVSANNISIQNNADKLETTNQSLINLISIALTTSTSWLGDVTGTGTTINVVNTQGLSGENITSGTVADARIASTIARDSELPTALSELTNDVNFIANGTDANLANVNMTQLNVTSNKIYTAHGLAIESNASNSFCLGGC